jgi:hypothetical protein
MIVPPFSTVRLPTLIVTPWLDNVSPFKTKVPPVWIDTLLNVYEPAFRVHDSPLIITKSPLVGQVSSLFPENRTLAVPNLYWPIPNWGVPKTVLIFALSSEEDCILVLVLIIPCLVRDWLESGALAFFPLPVLTLGCGCVNIGGVYLFSTSAGDDVVEWAGFIPAAFTVGTPIPLDSSMEKSTTKFTILIPAFKILRCNLNMIPSQNCYY